MQVILVKVDAARSFYPAEAPTPKSAPDAVLIKICATAVNRADLLQRRGLYLLAEVDKAHAHVAANKNFGKVVLRVRDP